MCGEVIVWCHWIVLGKLISVSLRNPLFYHSAFCLLSVQGVIVVLPKRETLILTHLFQGFFTRSEQNRYGSCVCVCRCMAKILLGGHTKNPMERKKKQKKLFVRHSKRAVFGCVTLERALFVNKSWRRSTKPREHKK